MSRNSKDVKKVLIIFHVSKDVKCQNFNQLTLNPYHQPSVPQMDTLFSEPPMVKNFIYAWGLVHSHTPGPCPLAGII